MRSYYILGFYMRFFAEIDLPNRLFLSDLPFCNTLPKNHSTALCLPIR